MHKSQGSFGIFFPETKRNDFFISGTRKETTFFKRGYFRITEKRKETTFLKRGYFKKRKRERKVVSTISAWRGPPQVVWRKFLEFKNFSLTSGDQVRSDSRIFGVIFNFTLWIWLHLNKWLNLKKQKSFWLGCWCFSLLPLMRFCMLFSKEDNLYKEVKEKEEALNSIAFRQSQIESDYHLLP